MRSFIIVVVALLMTACGDKVLSTRVVNTWEAKGEVSCNYFGLCHTCGIDYQGDVTCGMWLSSTCPGKQPALLQFVEIETIYETEVGSSESQKGTRSERHVKENRVVERLGDCR